MSDKSWSGNEKSTSTTPRSESTVRSVRPRRRSLVGAVGGGPGPDGDSIAVGGRKCFNCEKEGHKAYNCPDGGLRSRYCYNCGENGHLKRECFNARSENVERPPERSRDDEGEEQYVPPEMLEGEAIFAERSKLSQGTGINFANFDSVPVVIEGEGTVPSANNFADLGLHPLILKNLQKCKYETPTPIQRHGSPQLMAKKDVMCFAPNGSGKTAAFLLPIVNHLLENQSSLSGAGCKPVKPEALILAPTRELVIQIGNEANMYANGTIIKTQVVYDGPSAIALKDRLKRGCNILVATTGGLKVFLKEGVVDLSNVYYFIVDEADRMFDMNFKYDIEDISEDLPPKEECVFGMFTATFPDSLDITSKKMVTDDYIYVEIGLVGGACTDIKQEVVEAGKSVKRKALLDVLNKVGTDIKILVFCTTKRQVDALAVHLFNSHVSCTSIHGGRPQAERDWALRQFIAKKRQVLVATDVAARGLDIPQVDLVINFDLPAEIEEYVNRIGRTGRMGHLGRAISFFDKDEDQEIMSQLCKTIEDAGQGIPNFLESDCSSSEGYDGDLEEEEPEEGED